MIQIKDLSYSYPNKPELFKALNLKLQTGNIYGLLGKNGAGKSTLLKLIAGLLKVQTGHLEVMGQAPFSKDPALLSEIFMINEEFQLPKMTIHKYQQLYAPFYPKFDQESFQHYLNEFQLGLDQKLTNLSYGQKKKFIMSFGLATNSQLLIMDEPTNGLDIPSKSQFRKLISGAVNEERTFIISTHQVRDMENLIDPVIILDDGEVVFFEGMESIHDQLSVTKASKQPTDSGVIYAEGGFAGYTVIRQNTGDSPSRINLELLFQAVISNKEMIHEIFQPKANTHVS